MSTVTVVTGANSGIGRATAVHLASQGFEVYGTVRNPDSAGKLRTMAAAAGSEVHVVTMDIADDDSVRTGMGGILERAGRVDVLVNNAGIGGNAVAEECPPSMFADVMNVNLNGAVRCAQAVLPGMRERGAGTIVNVTSVVGRMGALAQAPYTASKWALEGLSEELALEVAPFGIRVAIVEPGITKSAIFAKNVDAPNSSGAYDAHYRRMFQFYAAGLTKATDPFEVAKVIHHAVTTDEPTLRYAVSWGAVEIIEGLRRGGDEAWVALGRAADDDAYYAGFLELFGLDLRPS